MLSRGGYERLIYTLPTAYPAVRFSTLVLAPPGLDVAQLTGLVALGDDCVLCVYELLDFRQGVIEAYRYEVSRCRPPFTTSPLPEAAEYCSLDYAGKDKLYWWPHPNDPDLASTHPHHKHVPPDIKRHRLPAPELSFVQPNLPFLIQEIEHHLLRPS